MLNKQLCKKCYDNYISTKYSLDKWGVLQDVVWDSAKEVTCVVIVETKQNETKLKITDNPPLGCKYKADQLILGNANDIHS